MANQLRQLTDAGQSIWLDNIRRSMFSSGELRALIANGLRGLTSNPTIFEKAIGSGDDYDEQLRSLVGTVTDSVQLFEALAVDDIRHACDLFRPLYDETNAGDGYVSLEVSPLLADNGPGTIEAAKRLWAAVNRPNLLVKIPATPECIPAIRETIANGINVNVTLVFSVETYEAASNAYIEGLEKRAASGAPIARVRSVNSVFVSRIDAAVDKMLEERIAKGENLSALLGKTAIANTGLIYGAYEKLFKSERFAALEKKGAAPMRPLWASTGVKSAAYSDLLYIENLVAPNTVNTVPPATLDALLDHGTVKADTIREAMKTANSIVEQIGKAGISLAAVTNKLQTEGVESFRKSFETMLAAIEKKRDRLAKGDCERVTLALGSSTVAVDSTLANLADRKFLSGLWAKDATLWSKEPEHQTIIKNALGWLDYPDHVLEAVGELTNFTNEVKSEFDHVVVLGMGGSSLAPDVLRATFGRIPGYPALHVLDSSDPSQVKTLEGKLNLRRSLFIVASKSGGTTEPDAFFRYFFDRVKSVVGEAHAPNQFVAITDPGTKLDQQATDMKLRHIFRNAPDIGGRYSALSMFGMVPAAIAGYNVSEILRRGVGTLHANGRSSDVKTAPGTRFGAAMGTLQKQGRDKVTIFTHPKVSAFGTWAEQLIAESTGKSGTGIVPVEGEPLGRPESYGSDRVFVYVGAGLPEPDAAMLDLLNDLQAAGHPIIRLAMNDLFDIGEQFAVWEIAVATAGCVMNIDAFDQPNVQESKDNTKRLLDVFAKRGDGHFDEPKPSLTTANYSLIPLSGSKSVSLGKELSSALAAIFDQVKPGDYVAFTCYLEMNEAHENLMAEVRTKVRNALKVATTVGFGPRFLHSTGQLHKGGANNGVFIQLTTDASVKVQIPGMVEFGVLERAQALGDFESLDSRNRRGTRLHMPNLEVGLKELAAAIEDAVSTKA
jgi:transaldolase/glucose-6-phosphate isomerase